MWCVYGLQTSASIKYSRFYPCHAFRNHNACKTFAIPKCVIHFRHAIWNRKTCKALAIAKCSNTYFCYTIWNRDAYKALTTAKCSNTYFCYAVWNRDAYNREGEPYRRNNLKAVAIAERILAECTDPEIRGWMQDNLCYFYERSGQHDKAIEAADKLSNLWSSREMIRMDFLKGDELMEFAQGVVTSLANAMYVTLWYLSDLDEKNDPQMTHEQRIEIQKKAIALYDIVFDKGDYNYYFHDVYHAYSHIAVKAALSGDRELALDSLEKAAKFAAADDDLPDKKPYTSLLVNRLEYNKKHSIKNFTFTYREELLEKLAWDGYDCIRDDPRFKAVESSLQK